MNVFPLFVGMALGFTAAWGRIDFSRTLRYFVQGKDTKSLTPIAIFVGSGIVFHAVLFGWVGYQIAPAPPFNVATLFGAVLFGIGTQCSGTSPAGALLSTGAGKWGALSVLLGLSTGSFLATLNDGFWGSAPALPQVSLPEVFGWPISVVISLGAVVLALLACNGRLKFARKPIITAVLLALFATMSIPASGHSWGIVWALTLLSAKASTILGWGPPPYGFWAQDWAFDALTAPLLEDTTVLMDAGFTIGAFAIASGELRFGGAARQKARELLRLAIGGFAMGYGAQISGGCDVGAFFGGVVSGSPYSWVWLVGCVLGAKMGLQLVLPKSLNSSSTHLRINRG